MRKAGFLFAAIMFAMIAAHAQTVPPLVNYQGMLTDSEGKPLTGTKKITFNLYDSTVAVASVWGPQIFENVPLINGMFNVILGTADTSGRPLADAFGAKDRYLGITVDGKEILPRQQILSTPFAIKAEQAAKAKQTEFRYAKIWEEKLSGTSLGNSKAGWNIRGLNKIDTNIEGLTLSSNQFILPSGFYRIEASSPSRHANGHKIALFNATDQRYEIIGTNSNSPTGYSQSSNTSQLIGVLNISQPKIFEIRHYITLAAGPYGLGGESTNISEIPEIYTIVFIEQKKF